MTKEAIMICLIRAELCGGTVSEEVKNALSEPMCKALFELSVKHDMAHIVAQTLDKLNVLGDDATSQNFRKAAKIALYRYIQQNSVFISACKTLEAEKIPFIPLKGALLRKFYPEPWMRTSCDIDILVKEADLPRAVKALEQSLSYKTQTRGAHDVSLSTPENVHLELHFSTIEDGRVRRAEQVLCRYWENAEPISEGAYEHKVSDEMFYFYHIAHMAKHVQEGGCGVRPFLDIWILNHRLDANKLKRNALLEEGGLLQFASASEALSEAWFGIGQTDSLLGYYEQFVFEGGKFGTLENQVALKRVKAGGQLRYIFSRIFQPYGTLKLYYPALKKHKWLMPYYQLVRWCRLLFKGTFLRAMREVKAGAGVSEKTLSSAEDLLDELGL